MPTPPGTPTARRPTRDMLGFKLYRQNPVELPFLVKGANQLTLKGRVDQSWQITCFNRELPNPCKKGITKRGTHSVPEKKNSSIGDPQNLLRKKKIKNHLPKTKKWKHSAIRRKKNSSALTDDCEAIAEFQNKTNFCKKMGQLSVQDQVPNTDFRIKTTRNSSKSNLFTVLSTIVFDEIWVFLPQKKWKNKTTAADNQRKHKNHAWRKMGRR